MICIEASAVNKAYGEGSERTEVLKNLNLKVEDGEFVAIVGFSGSGKTTLMSIVSRASKDLTVAPS